MLWDDLSRVIHPAADVTEARKNILLYKLKNEPDDPMIQGMRKTAQLRAERQKFNARIQNMEEKWEAQEFTCRQKGK